MERREYRALDRANVCRDHPPERRIVKIGLRKDVGIAATDKWIDTANADWGSSSRNWSTGFPTSKDDVVVNTGTVLTVTYGAGDTFAVNSLTVGNDVFDMTGGSLTIATTASFSGGFVQTGGTLTAGAVTIGGGSGALNQLLGGTSEGKTAFTVKDTLTLDNYSFGGASVLNNTKTTNLTAGIQLGDDTGVGATINNEKGATFNIAGNFGITQGAATAHFINAGTLVEETGSSSFIGVNVTDTGSIPTTALPARSPAPDKSTSAVAAKTRSPPGQRLRRRSCRFPTTTLS